MRNDAVDAENYGGSERAEKTMKSGHAFAVVAVKGSECGAHSSAARLTVQC